MAEEFLERQAGEEAYHGAFLAHYLDRLVYPDLPLMLLVGVGVAVCVVTWLLQLASLASKRLLAISRGSLRVLLVLSVFVSGILLAYKTPPPKATAASP